MSSFVMIIFVVSFACFASIHTEEISFLKYCLNSTEPEVLPTEGEGSSGTMIMSVKNGSNPWYFPDLNCTVTLRTEDNFHIFMAFSNVSLRNSSMDNLTVSFDNENARGVLSGQQVCSNENCEGLKFDSGVFNNMSFHFVSANVTVPDNVTGFLAHYTVYKYVDSNTGACVGKNKFLCENKHCIWYNFVCDGHNNCGDMSDENKCIIPTRDTVWGILTVVIAVVSIIIFVPVFLFLAFYGNKSRIKSIQVPNDPTPMSNAVAANETSGLLTSSEAISNSWPVSYNDARGSLSYGTSDQPGPSRVVELDSEPVEQSSHVIL